MMTISNSKRNRILEIYSTDKDNKLGFDKVVYYIKKSLSGPAGDWTFHLLYFSGKNITRARMDDYIMVNGYKLKEYNLGKLVPFMVDMGCYINNTGTRAIRRFVSARDREFECS